MQRNFVKNLSNGITGTLMTLIAAAIAKAGRATGKKDKDKDVADFERYVLGYQPYSFKIGDTSFSYDWAQPSAATMAIMADYFEGEREAELTGEEKAFYQKILDAVKVGGDVLYNQSFMTSIQNLFGDDGFWAGLLDTLLQDPSANIPQLLSQTASAVDPSIRNSYEYENDAKTALNKVLYKIPFARNMLAESVDVLGNTKKQYGNDAQRAIASFFSVANVSQGYSTKAGDEVYRLYQSTGEASVIPPQAPNYVTKNGGKLTISAKQKAEYQKVMGKISSEAVEKLVSNKQYSALDDDYKAELLTEIYSYARQVANKNVLGVKMTESAEKANETVSQGVPVYEYFTIKKMADANGNGSVTQEEARAILDASDLTKKQKEIMWKAFNSKWKSNPYRYSYY
jgi:hypothetical protein